MPDRDTIQAATLYTTSEAAFFLGVSRQTVVNLIESDSLPASKLPSGHRRILGADLLDLLRRTRGES